MQRDYESGVGVDEYHRLNTARKMGDDFGTRIQQDNFNEFGAVEEHLDGTDEILLGESKNLSSGPNILDLAGLKDDQDELRPKKLGNASTDSLSGVSAKIPKYDNQRASFRKSIPQNDQSESERDEISFQEAMAPPPQQPAGPRPKSRVSKTKPKVYESDSSFGSPEFQKTSVTAKELASLESDMQNLLAMIKAYSPENIELEPKLNCFTPEFIPCIGDIDPMIKIPMPKSIRGNPLDSKLAPMKELGLVMLDEPNSIQSDPAGSAS